MPENDFPIYLDNAATTPVDPRVINAIVKNLSSAVDFGNPASYSHEYGWRAQEAVEVARHQVSALINASPEEIVWTSGATESNNLALKGCAISNYASCRHIITTGIEHKSVIASCRWLASQGYEITYLRPTSEGVIDPNYLMDHLRSDTVLCSVMHVNHEIGSIQQIAEIGEVLRSRGVLFHVDAAQSAGKVPIDVEGMNIDLLSLSAHKVYGPKGVGALYVRRRPRVRIEPQIHGGGQERGLRSGTIATHQIVGMGTAFEIAAAEMASESVRLEALRTFLWNSVKDISGIRINGHPKLRVAGNLNVSIDGVDGQKLIGHLQGLAVSSGSACTSSSLEPSYVLKAIGLNDNLAQAAIRFSIGRFNSEQEIGRAVEIVRHAVASLRPVAV